MAGRPRNESERGVGGEERTETLLVREAADRSRFEVLQDDELVGFADYVRTPEAVLLPHTEVNRESRGRGIASELVRVTLETFRDRGEQVLPQCSFVSAYIRHNPEFVQLVPLSRRAGYGLAAP